MGCKSPGSLTAWAAYCDCLETVQQDSTNKIHNSRNDSLSNVQMDKVNKKSQQKIQHKHQIYDFGNKKTNPINPKKEIPNKKRQNTLAALNDKSLGEGQISDFFQPTIVKTTDLLAIIPLDEDPDIRSRHTRNIHDSYPLAISKDPFSSQQYINQTVQVRRRDSRLPGVKKRFYLDQQDHQQYMASLKQP